MATANTKRAACREFAFDQFDRGIQGANGHRLALSASRASFAEAAPNDGTTVKLRIEKGATRQLASVFAEFCHPSVNQIPIFDRTVFLLQLARSEGRLVSRSQAKRIMNGMERFSTVEVDFSGIDTVGQGFADEMFRVWPSLHRETKVEPVHTPDPIKMVISRVRYQAGN